MKPHFFIALFTAMAVSISVYSQDFLYLKGTPLKDKTDYQKNEGKALECASYILKTPINEKNLNRQCAIQFLLRWMEGTPDYSFNMDETYLRVTKSDPNLMGVMMAGMAKYILENKDKTKDAIDVKYNSIVLVLNYCEIESNNVSVSRDLKKMISAKNGNKLKDYLGI